MLRCCSVSGAFADSRAMLELAARRVDWNRFLALANRNGVTPMAGARLGEEGAASLPPRVARAMRLSCQVTALRNNHLAGCAVEIVDSFAAAGVPAIAIKGPALAIAAYGDVAMRVFGDLDFMVRLEDLPRAAAALERRRVLVACLPCRRNRERILPRRGARLRAPGLCGRSPMAVVAQLLPVCSRRRAGLEADRRNRNAGPARSHARPRRLDSVSGLSWLQARLDDTCPDLRLCPRAGHRSDRELLKPPATMLAARAASGCCCSESSWRTR